MKYLSLILGVLLVVGCISIFSFQSDEEEEDVASYNIQNRHECYQIKDNQEYNECLMFYLINDPYEDDEKLVATRLVK